MGFVFCIERFTDTVQRKISFFFLLNGLLQNDVTVDEKRNMLAKLQGFCPEVKKKDYSVNI